LQELGTFTAIWSQIDFMTIKMIALLLKISDGPAQFLLEATTTGPRINMLSRLCKEDPDELKKDIRKTCDKNNGLVEDRNHIMHGLWAVEWNTATDETSPGCYFSKGKREPIKATKLKELSNRAAIFSNPHFSNASKYVEAPINYHMS
jgi:hypothetical protein